MPSGCILHPACLLFGFTFLFLGLIGQTQFSHHQPPCRASDFGSDIPSSQIYTIDPKESIMILWSISSWCPQKRLLGACIMLYSIIFNLHPQAPWVYNGWCTPGKIQNLDFFFNLGRVGARLNAPPNITDLPGEVFLWAFTTRLGLASFSFWCLGEICGSMCNWLGQVAVFWSGGISVFPPIRGHIYREHDEKVSQFGVRNFQSQHHHLLSSPNRARHAQPNKMRWWELPTFFRSENHRESHPLVNVYTTMVHYHYFHR